MANYQLRQPASNFTDARRSDVTYQTTLPNDVDLGSISSLRSALQAYDAFTYTNAELDRMTVNDMVFAWRSIRNPTSIHDKQTQQAARVRNAFPIGKAEAIHVVAAS